MFNRCSTFTAEVEPLSTNAIRGELVVKFPLIEHRRADGAEQTERLAKAPLDSLYAGGDSFGASESDLHFATRRIEREVDHSRSA
jgi:hypothetical protein